MAHLLKSDISNAEFIKNRLLRIYSVLIPCLVLTFIMDSMGSNLTPVLYTDEAYNSGGFLKQLIVTMLLLNQIWFSHLRFGSNGPIWSLSYEVWYYLFAFLLFRLRHLKFPFLLVLLVFIGFKLWLLLPTFLLGIGFYLYKDRLPKFPLWLLAAVPLLILVQWVFGGQFIADKMQNLDWYRLEKLFFSYHFILDNLFCIFLFVFSGVVYQNQRLLTKVPSWFQQVIYWCARRSFSFYIFNYPVLIFVTAVWSHFGNFQDTWINISGLAMVTMIICYMLSPLEFIYQKVKAS